MIEVLVAIAIILISLLFFVIIVNNFNTFSYSNMATLKTCNSSERKAQLLLDVDILDTTTLKHIYDSVKFESGKGLQSDNLLACLEHTALEDANCETVTELLQRKRYAFECLRLLSFDLSEEFCLMYYDSVMMVLQLIKPGLLGSPGCEELNIYMAESSTSLEMKKLVLQTLTICLSESDVNFSIFKQFSPSEWRYKLLLYVLLNQHNVLELSIIQRITTTINQLEDFLKNNDIQWTVEDILETLVTNHKKCDINIHVITDMFVAIPFHLDIFYMLPHKVSAVKDKINEVKMLEFIGRCDSIELLSENYPEILQYIVSLPVHIMTAISTKIDENFEEVIAFTKLLLNCCNTEETSLTDFLFRLDLNDSVDVWRYNMCFQIVKNRITTFFPQYSTYSYNGSVSDKILRDISLSCTCFKVQCILHHTKKCCELLYFLNCTMARLLKNFSNPTKTTLDTIDLIVSLINKSQRILEFENALKILEEFNIEFTDLQLQAMFSEDNVDNYERHMHKLVVGHSFLGTYEKSAEQLVEELESINPGITMSTIELFVNVNNTYKNKSMLFPNSECIEFWNKTQIKSWVLSMHRTPVPDEEKLAVIKRAAKLILKVHLRDVQLLAIITMIKCNKGKGRLCQVNTGEGKTLVIAMIAVYYVFEKHTVDIYTSSPVLAIPQAKEFEDFYSLFNISVSNNVQPNSNYRCDVIYGTNHSFQRDVLQDEFMKYGTRSGREFDVVIVDEVDNMLVDGNNWILKLSRNMPAMDYLEILLAAIYIQVNTIAGSLIEKEGQIFYRDEDVAFDENGNAKSEVKYREIPIKGTKKDFIIQCTESHIRKLVRDTNIDEKVDDEYPEIKIPKHLREVICKVQIRKWIVNAIQSIFNYVEGEDYVLEDGKVTIVDADNTGVLKRSSHWTHGLHQFLQIKHGAKIEPESFTSNFISNVALFTRYSSIYGLTGTLGNNDTRHFLHDTYDVDSVIIPPFKHKQHKHLKSMILQQKRDWYLEIARNCISKLQNSRSVLIIMKYIRETEELAKVFREDFSYDNSKIKLYKTDRNLEVLEMPLNSGDVIITTNIAGRGTDIKLKQKIEDNGGLHVCLTFLPLNSRVEEQNIGRTSRKGNRGTSQLILHEPASNQVNVDDLKACRSKIEKRIIKDALNIVKKTKMKDKIFQIFCRTLDEIVLNTEGEDVKEIKREALEERFGIWLQIHEQNFEDENIDTLEDFDVFKKLIMSENNRNELIQNPYLYVRLGNKYLKNRKFENAINAYTKAINLDHNFAENAYYNRAWAYLSKYGGNLSDNEKFVDNAIKDLNVARKLIQDKEYGLHLMQTASKNETFSEQITHKLNLYNIQKNVIEMAIGPDIESIDEQLKKMITIKEGSKSISLEEKDKISQVINKLNEDKKNTGVIGRAKSNKRDIKIEPLPNDFIPECDKASHEEEMNEFKRNGWHPGFQVTEIKPIDWKSVIGLLGIGLGQLLIGAALTVFTLGAGATIGMGFISQGVSDIITAVKDGIINRDFDWGMWALMKVISLTVSIVCAGLKAIKDVACTAYAGVKNVATVGAKAFTQVAKEGWKIAAKKIGFELAKGVGKEIVTELVNYGIDKTLVPMIEEAIVEIVQVPIERALYNNSRVINMLKIDENKENNDFENQIRIIGQKLLSPKVNSKLSILAAHTAKCIADNTGLGNVHQIYTLLKSSREFSMFTSDFITDFNKAIDKIKMDDDEDHQLTQCNSSSEQDQGQVEETSASDAPNKSDDIDLNKINQPVEQVQHKKQWKKCTPNDLSTEFAGIVSTSMVKIMTKNVVSPIIHMGVSYTVDGLSSKVHKSLQQETEVYRSGKRILDDNNRAYKNISTNKKSPQLSEEDTREVNKLLKEIEDGGPVNLLHLGPLSKAANKQFEIYNENGELMFPVGDSQKGGTIKLEYHSSDNDSNIGHFTLLGKKEPLAMGRGSNMCAFNCVAELTNKDPNQLKRDTIEIMQSNKSVLAARLGDIKMLQMSHSSALSIKGGAEYYGKNYRDALQYISSSAGRRGFGNINPGHPEIHASYKGNPKIMFSAMSNEISRKIIVVNKKGKELYTTGSQYGGEPIVFQYNVDKKDPANNYFSERGGTNNCVLKTGNDASFYSYMSMKSGKNVGDLKTATETRINKIIIPSSESCIENKSKAVPPPPRGKPQTGFLSIDDEAFVLDAALKTPAAKNRLAQLNRYQQGVRQSKQYTKIPVTIPAKDLNLPRQVLAGEWVNGHLISTFPINDVFVLLQHHDGHQSNPKAQVHIQTFYPPQ